jgi:hydroxyacylglutathione hydrolase
MAEVERLVADGRPTLPTTIGREKATNPFLRADDPELMAKLGMAGADPAEIFAEIRTRKDRFRG